MFAVLRLLKTLETDQGGKISCHGMQGCEGMIPVFNTIEEAEAIYGEGVELLPIEVAPRGET